MQSISMRIFRTLALLILCAHSVLSAAEIRWQFEVGGRVIGRPTITENRIYIAGGNTVHALTTAGAEVWRRDLPGDIAAGITADEDRLFVHSSVGLHALTEAGEEIWFHEIPDLGPLVDGRSWEWGNEILADPWGWYRSAPTVQDGSVVFGGSGGVHAVSKETGELLWQVPLGPVTADLVVHEGTIVVACWNNSVYGLDAVSGEVRWRFQGGVPSSKGADWIGYQGFHLTPMLHEGEAYVGTGSGTLYAVDLDP